jgi:hypothetical protein
VQLGQVGPAQTVRGTARPASDLAEEAPSRAVAPGATMAAIRRCPTAELS